MVKETKIIKHGAALGGLMVFMKLYYWWKGGKKGDMVVEEDMFYQCKEERIRYCMENMYMSDPYTLKTYKCGEYAKKMCVTPDIQQPIAPREIILPPEKPAIPSGPRPMEPVAPNEPIRYDQPGDPLQPIIVIPPETEAPPLKRPAIFG